MNTEPRIIRDIRDHAEFLSDRRSEGHTTVDLDEREGELLQAWERLTGERDLWIERESHLADELQRQRARAEADYSQVTGERDRLAEALRDLYDHALDLDSFGPAVAKAREALSGDKR